MKSITLTSILFASILGAMASEEEYLPLSNIELQAEVKELGSVRLQVSSKDGEISSILIERDGKKSAIPAEEIAKMVGFRFHQVSATHEAGYPQTGGHTFGFKLSGYQREGEPGKKHAWSKKETFVISIPKTAPANIIRRPVIVNPE